MMRLNDHGGLACTAYGWILVAVIVVVWIATPRLVLRRTGAGAVWGSLFTLFAIGFGTDFVVRFFLLAYDSIEFGNDTFRLADLPSTTVDRTLEMVLLFLVSVAIGFVGWPRGRAAGVLAAVDVLGGRAGRRYAVLAGTTACAILAAGPFHVPLALLTPLGIAGTFWVIPATLVWADHFASGAGDRDGRLARWLVLSPAVLRFAVSPFREHLLPLLLVPLVARLCVYGRLSRRHLAVATLAVPLFVFAGKAVQAYRDVLWGGKPLGHVVETVSGENDDQELPDPDWLVALRRFHGLDSLLLTVDLVPQAFPFRGDAVVSDAFARGLVPRVLLPEKVMSDRGPEFARTIWAYDSGFESEAAIAPSMPGDLYHAGGAWTVALGALVWGLLLGMLERWKDALRPPARAAVLVLFATQVVPSVERDFEHCVATLLQTLLVLAILGGVLSLGRRGRRPAPLGLVPPGQPA